MEAADVLLAVTAEVDSMAEAAVTVVEDNRSALHF
jgi:hypothetical protein